MVSYAFVVCIVPCPNCYYIQSEVIMRIFKCPLCQRYPLGAVYTCPARHIVCGDCRPNVSKCPWVNCSEFVYSKRDTALERRIELGTFACLYRDYGCKEMLHLKDHEKHATDCKYREFCCPGCKLQVPVDPNAFAEDYRKTNSQALHGVDWLGKRRTDPTNYKQFLTKGDDPWLCTEKPEKIEGFPDEDSVAMQPIPQTPNLTEPKGKRVRYVYRGNGGNNVIVEVLPKREQNSLAD